ncbi:baseplate J/gp47 family protein [Paenibacillus psychroresistens]|uniref:Baseplate J/gp47 family protein n=1 Tax=Paenibacillus psychroresistens TaxID=1778678 RepID=A0A6B8RKY1_9BACL|nr:baseplate J/gp47 family protein [Paenibacillus psychroresistens]QGQ97051.1 baseplate J/gp47 family protein [Paenibacillus psychroresistens]
MSEFTEIQFVDADAQRIENELIDAYFQETGQVLYPGDPRRIFLLQLLPVLVALKNNINFTANQNLLPFAIGDVLDGLGERIGVPRLVAQVAYATMRFTLSAVQLSPVTILQGTRVTPDGILYFATIADLVIAPGDTTGDMPVKSTVGGNKYNFFVAGQINIIVDPVPFVASAVNLGTSSGGSDDETDDAYRERQRLAPDSFSVAGPTGAYIFFAKSADINIADVSVTSPSAGAVNVYVLMKNGLLPDAPMLAKVLLEVNTDNRRPLTDYVQVLAPTVVNYNITLTYYIASERSAEVTTIRAAIENTGGAIDQYVSWQYAKLGRTISPDTLLSYLYGAGAFRVVITTPAYATITASQVGKLVTKTVTYGGLI